MIKDWRDFKVQNGGIVGARAYFEDACHALFTEMFGEISNVKQINPNPGDGGIDIYIGDLYNEPVDVYQCKFFLEEFGAVQKSQIKKSFERIISNPDIQLNKWTLCIPWEFDLENDSRWWANWKRETQRTYTDLTIEFLDGKDLIHLFKKYKIYTTYFNLIDSLNIEEIHKKLIDPYDFTNLKSDLEKSSFELKNQRKYFGNNSSIFLKSDITKKLRQRIEIKSEENNITLLVGNKGVGKSVMMSNLLNSLGDEDDIFTLGIKCDKTYAKNLPELEKLIFSNNLNFLHLKKYFKREINKKFVIILDQLDALSQTMTSNRAFLSTYKKLIEEFKGLNNVFIFISCRIYDLEYDPDINFLKRKNTIFNLDKLTHDEVKNILNRYRIRFPNDKTLGIISTANNLDIYCRIFSNSTTVNNINSENQLLQELWRQVINEKKELKVKEFLYRLSTKMYEEQKIIQSINAFTDDYQAEINYLLSNGILTNKGGLQFFHQTFYEYSLAKNFVENNVSLKEYIIKEKQSLFIRSIVKNVIEFLRDYDFNLYLNTFCELIRSEDIRFHIKVLLIQFFSSIQNVHKKEIQVFYKYVIVNKNLNEIFISSFHSKEWVDCLINNNIYKDLFYDNDDYSKKLRTDLIFSLASNVSFSPVLIFEYISSFTFTNKDFTLSWLMRVNSNWEDKRAQEFFLDNYKIENNPDEVGYTNILEKIFPYNQYLVYQCIEHLIEKSIESTTYSHSFSYRIESILEFVFTINPECSFHFLLSKFKKIISSDNIPLYADYYIEEKSVFYFSPKFFRDEYKENYNKSFNFFLDKYIKERLSKNEGKFRIFFSENYDSNNLHVIMLLINTILESPNSYANEGFKLFKKINVKNGLKGINDRFLIQVRKLISECFIYFTTEQKEYILEFINSYKTSHEVFAHEVKDKKTLHSYYGKGKYLFMLSIPENELFEKKILRKEFLELKRKYGKLDPFISVNYGIRGGLVGPPLSAKAYNNMTLLDWRKSMNKINDQYEHPHFLKGGVSEHARQFKGQIKKSPKKHFDFIKDLLKDVVPLQYKLEAISGLIDAEYDAEKINSLVNDILCLELPRYNYYDLTSLNNYLVKNNVCNDNLIYHLRDFVLLDEEIDKEHQQNESFMNGLNSVKGSILFSLINCYSFEKHEELIFSTVEKVIRSEKCSDSIRTYIVHNLAYLNKLNIERNLELFKGLILNSKDKEVLKHARRTGHYLQNKFHEHLDFYYKRLLDTKDLHEDSFILVNAWLKDWINDKNLYNKFVQSSLEAKKCALTTAEKWLFSNDKSINKRALSILYEFLCLEEKELSQLYASLILREFKVNRFEELFDFCLAYSKSYHAIQDNHYFIDYLIKCSEKYPLQCLEIIQNLDFRNWEYGIHSDSPVKLILMIYSKLHSLSDFDSTLYEKQIEALSLFDKMLEHNHLRQNAVKAMEEIIE